MGEIPYLRVFSSRQRLQEDLSLQGQPKWMNGPWGSGAMLHKNTHQWPVYHVLFGTSAGWQVLPRMSCIRSLLIFLNLKEELGKEVIRGAVLRVLSNCTWPDGSCSRRHYQAQCCLLAQNGVFSLSVQFALAGWRVNICGKPRWPAKGLFLSWINRTLQVQVQDQQRFMETCAVPLAARALCSPEMALSF